MQQTDSEQRGGGRETRGEEGEGSSQGTGINDPWTWTTGWGMTVGARGGGGATGENWDNCNRTIKNAKDPPRFQGR